MKVIMNVLDERKKYGLTQQELADKTGIPRHRIAKWEKDKGSPKAEDNKTLEEFFSKLAKQSVKNIRDKVHKNSNGNADVEVNNEDCEKQLSIMREMLDDAKQHNTYLQSVIDRLLVKMKVEVGE